MPHISQLFMNMTRSVDSVVALDASLEESLLDLMGDALVSE
jgi:hypothetical protein